jgi:hypothetical protein
MNSGGRTGLDGPAKMSDATIAKVEDYIGHVVAAVEGTDFYPRDIRQYAFDTIASSMMSKAVALAKSCIILLKANQPDEAFGLSRSLVECALILRYITSDEALQSERTAQFVGFSFEYKNLWLYHARNQSAGQPYADEIERYAKRWKLTGDARQAKKHWSRLRGFTWDAQTLIHPLDDAGFDLYKEKQYAVDYTQTCQWVHCSQPALDNYVQSGGASFAFIESSEEFGNPRRTVLYILVNHLYLVMRFALYGMQITSPEGLHRAFSETLNALVVIDRDGGLE